MPRPTLDQLESFAVAARLLNFRAAARTVGLSPGAFSQRIRGLEEQLGAALFHRSTRSVELTVAGLALLPEAKRCLEVADACASVVATDMPPSVELTLGTRFEIGLSWLVPALRTLEQAHPHLRLNLYFGASDDLLARLRSGTVDCAVSSVRLADAGLRTESLHPEDYVFVGQRRLLSRVPLSRPSHAARHCLLDIDATLPLYRYFADARHGAPELAFGRHRWVGLGVAIERLVSEGEGVAVLPRYMVQPAIDRGTLVPLFPRTRLNCDEFRLIFHREDPRRAVFVSLADALRALPLQ